MRLVVCLAVAVLPVLPGCLKKDHLGKVPTFTPSMNDQGQYAMMDPGLPKGEAEALRADPASLWSRNRESLLGDRRAEKRGDILTVVVEIDEEAEFQNSTSRSRSASQSMGMPQLFGLSQRLAGALPTGATIDPALSIKSSSTNDGDGSVRRNEKITLRVAATVVDVMPNGVLSITGSQEVRLNYDIRELLVTGFVRPEDISRQNEITYDKIASARVSYGGRGQIFDMQQPRIGQQVLEQIVPF